MRSTYVFILIALCLLTMSGALAWFVDSGDDRALYVIGAVLLLNLILLIPLYRMSVKPMRSLSNGVDLLQGQDFSSRLAPVKQYEADRIVNMFNRMMDALKNERLHLREQNHFLDLLIGVSPMGIIILNDYNRIANANKAAASFLNLDSPETLAGMTLEDCDSPLAPVLMKLAPEDVQTVRLNDSMIYRCSRLSFMDKGYRHPFLLIERLTEEVMKAEKKSYEKVIRVIAHEVNNTMGGIGSILDTVCDSVGEDEDGGGIGELLGVCRSRGEALSRFISNFANVVKIPEVSLSRSDLNSVVSSERILLESMCVKHGIDFSVTISDEPVPVDVDAVLFEQVLINIVKNSVESIGDGMGEVSVTVIPEGKSLVVADNGCGIAPDVAEKLFSPFFSTKPEGQGIGLMFIREVLHQHGCRFSLVTGKDGWTRFTIIFP